MSVTNSVSQSKQILIVCYVYVLFNVQVVVCSVLLLLCGWKRIPIVFPFVCSLLFILVVFVFRALLFCLSSNFVLCFIFKLSRKNQFGYRRQSDRLLSADSRLNGSDQQVRHVLLATAGRQRPYMGRYQSQPSAGLRKHQRIQSDHSCRGNRDSIV